MSAQPRTTEPMIGRRVRVGTAAVAAVLLSAGCAAGQVAQTANEKSSIDGNNVSVKTMDLRAVAVQAPPSQQPYYRIGTAAALKVVFVNNGGSDDRLTGVQTSAAGSWSYFTDYNDAFHVQEQAIDAVTGAPKPSPSASSSESSSDSSSASSSGSSDSSASSSSSSSPTRSSSPSPSSSSALPTGMKSVTIAAGSRVSFGTPDAKGALLLTGVQRALYPGNTVTITFTFAKAGSVKVAVPVQLDDATRSAVASGGGD